MTRAAFFGLPGSGKTVMARAFARDEDVRRAFPDGVLWITLERDEGQPIDFSRLQSVWGRALRDPAMPPSGYPDKLTGAAQLRSLLQNKACLLIVDDVWDVEQVRPPFLVGGPQCLLLLTTRRLEVADEIGAMAVELSPMTPTEGLTLIEHWCGVMAPADRNIAASLAEEVGYLPLALELMAAQARSLGWPAYRDRWRAQKLSALRRGRRGTGRENSVLDSFELSFNSLAKADGEAYQQLAVFGPNTLFPASAAAALWNFSEPEAEDLLRDLSKQALVKRTGEGAAVGYSLHSLLHEFLLARVGTTVTSLHSALVDGYRRRAAGGWPEVVDDGYFAARLAFHLVAAGRVDELWTLIDKPWMNAQFRRALSHASFLADIRVALQAARQRLDVPAFVRCALVYTIVDGMAGDDPDNIPPALAELGELQLATSRASALSRPDSRSKAYIEIANVMLERNRQAEALVAAKQALTAAEASDFKQSRGAGARRGVPWTRGWAGGPHPRARTHPRRGNGSGKTSERVSALAAVAVGLHDYGDRASADAVAGEMVQAVETSAADETQWLFSDAASALRSVGPVDFLERLRRLAVELLGQGVGGYPLSSVAPALVARGEIDAGIAAAELIPEATSQATAFGEIATLLAQAGHQDRATEVFQRAIVVLESEFRRGQGNLGDARNLLTAASLLHNVSAVASLQATHAKADAVWESWFLAGLSRAHHLAGSDIARIPELARQAAELLRAAARKGEIHGEAVRAETAGFLAEAGAITEAISVADDIDDSRNQKEALASIARHLLKAGRNQDARSLLMRALAIGRPNPDTHLLGVAYCARGLAHAGKLDEALSAIDHSLQLAAGLESGDARVGMLVSALDVLHRCGQGDRAREIAAEVLRLLVGSEVQTFDHRLRNEAFHLTGRLAFGEFNATLPSLVNWHFRRSVLRGVVKALVEAGDRERARRILRANRR